MWNFLAKLGVRKNDAGKTEKSLDSVFAALDDGAAERPLPTLVCRTCGLKYENTGTYLQGSRCPSCYPAS